MKKLLGIIIVAAIVFTGCKKCMECQLIEECAQCDLIETCVECGTIETCLKCDYTYNGMPIYMYECSTDSFEIDWFVDYCEDNDGTISRPTELVPQFWGCSADKAVRDSFQNYWEANSMICSYNSTYLDTVSSTQLCSVVNEDRDEFMILFQELLYTCAYNTADATILDAEGLCSNNKKERESFQSLQESINYTCNEQ